MADNFDWTDAEYIPPSGKKPTNPAAPAAPEPVDQFDWTDAEYIPPKKANLMTKLGQYGQDFKAGAASSVADIANLVGANDVAESIRVANPVSDEYAASQQAGKERFDKAQGFVESAKALGENFADAPGHFIAQTVGGVAPFLLGSAAAGAAKYGPSAFKAAEALGPEAVAAFNAQKAAYLGKVATGIDVSQGALAAGQTKGGIYDSNKQQYIDKGMSPEQAAAQADKDSALFGPNSAAIAGNAALGYVAGKYATEGAVGKALAKGSIPATLTPGIIRGAAVEAGMQGAAGAAQNVGVQAAVNAAGEKAGLANKDNPSLWQTAGEGFIGGALPGAAFGAMRGRAGNKAAANEKAQVSAADAAAAALDPKNPPPPGGASSVLAEADILPDGVMPSKAAEKPANYGMQTNIDADPFAAETVANVALNTHSSQGPAVQASPVATPKAQSGINPENGAMRIVDPVSNTTIELNPNGVTGRGVQKMEEAGNSVTRALDERKAQMDMSNNPPAEPAPAPLAPQSFRTSDQAQAHAEAMSEQTGTAHSIVRVEGGNGTVRYAAAPLDTVAPKLAEKPSAAHAHVFDIASRNISDEEAASSLGALRQRGISLDTVGSNGTTPLTQAVAQGNETAVNRLLQAGALIDAPDGQGMTALDRAVKANDAKAVARLLRLGASPDSALATLGPAAEGSKVSGIREALQAQKEVNDLFDAKANGSLIPKPAPTAEAAPVAPVQAAPAPAAPAAVMPYKVAPANPAPVATPDTTAQTAGSAASRAIGNDAVGQAQIEGAKQAFMDGQQTTTPRGEAPLSGPSDSEALANATKFSVAEDSKYSQQNGEGQGHTRDELSARVSRIFNGMKSGLGDSIMRVLGLQSAEQVKALSGEGVSRGTQGFEQDGKATLIHDQVRKDMSDAQLMGLVVHELAVHALRLGKGSKQFAEITARFQKMLDNGNKEAKAAEARVPEGTKAEHRMEEMIAYLLEGNYKSPEAQKMRTRVIEYVRQALRAVAKTLKLSEKGKFLSWVNGLNTTELSNIATQALLGLQKERAPRTTRSVLTTDNVRTAADKSNYSMADSVRKAGDRKMSLSEKPISWDIVEAKTPEEIEKYIKAGADINAYDDYGTTALMYASIANNIEGIKAIGSFKPNFEHRDKEGITALSHAASNKNNNVMAALLDAGADINGRQGYPGDTPLMQAVKFGTTKYGTPESAVNFLLDRGADVYIKNERGQTALDIAEERQLTGVSERIKGIINGDNARKERADILKSLKQKTEDTEGRKSRRLSVSDRELDASDSSNDKTVSLMDFRAEAKGDAPNPKTLARLAKEVDADARVRLMREAANNYPEAIGPLVEAGQKVNAFISDGENTAAHLAAKKGNLDTLAALAKNGADFTMVNEDGYTPHQIAIESGKSKAADFILAQVERADLSNSSAIGLPSKKTARRLSVADDPKSHPFYGFDRKKFLGKPAITTAKNAANMFPAEWKYDWSKPEPFLGKYQAKTAKEGIVVKDGDKVIGSYYNTASGSSDLVVAKGYRKQGIGSEMIYQYRMANPDAPTSKARTRGAQAVQESVWRRIERELTELEVRSQNRRLSVAEYEAMPNGSHFKTKSEARAFIERNMPENRAYDIMRLREAYGDKALEEYKKALDFLDENQKNAQLDRAISFEYSPDRFAPEFIKATIDAGATTRSLADGDFYMLDYNLLTPEQVKKGAEVFGGSTGKRGMLFNHDDVLSGTRTLRDVIEDYSRAAEARREREAIESASANPPAAAPVEEAPAPRKARRLSIQERQAGVTRDGTPIMDGKAVAHPSTFLNWFDKVRLEYQDKFAKARHFQDLLQKTLGHLLPDKYNFSDAADLSASQGAFEMDKFNKSHVDPLVDYMRANNLTQARMHEYMHARHAFERNAEMKRRNPGMPNNDALSGMSNETAASILGMDLTRFADPKEARAALERANPMLEKAAKMVEAMSDYSAKKMVDSGQESKTTVENWRKGYEFYVPLKREGFDDKIKIGGNLKKAGVSGSTVKEAAGSSREVQNILAHSVMDAHSVIKRENEGNLIKTFAAMIKKYDKDGLFAKLDVPPPAGSDMAPEMGDSGQYGIDKAPKFVLDRDGNIDHVEWKIDPSYKNRDNAVLYRVGGRDFAILLNADNPAAMTVARAFKERSTAMDSGLLKTAKAFSGYIAKVNTALNPFFAVFNFLRDTGTAAINSMNTPELRGNGMRIIGKQWGNMLNVSREISALRNGRDPASSIGKDFREFAAMGGMGGLMESHYDAKDQARDIEQLLNPKMLRVNGFGELPSFDGDRIPLGVGKVKIAVEHFNDMLELTTRFAAFQVAKKNGATPMHAAAIAKNLTTNFSRKGHKSAQMGALYSFFNASVQGTTNTLNTIIKRDPETGAYRPTTLGYSIIAGGLLAGVAQSAALAAFGYNDNDISEYDKNKNLLLPGELFGGEHKLIKIVIPQGFSLLPTLGRLAMDFAQDPSKTHAFEAVANMIGAGADTFSPIGGGLSVNTFAPSMLDDALSLITNKNAMGSSIAKVNTDPSRPTTGLSRAYSNASIPSREIAGFINSITGGTDFSPGAFSPSPDQIDYIFSAIGGGMLREPVKLAKAAFKAETGQDLKPADFPLAAKFTLDPAESSSVRANYTSNRAEIFKVASNLKGLKGAELAEYKAETPLAKMVVWANGVESKIKGHQETIKKTDVKLQKADLLSDERVAYRAKIQEEQDKIKALQEKVNARFLEIKNSNR